MFCVPTSSGESWLWSWLSGSAPRLRRKVTFSIRPRSTARKRGVWPQRVRHSRESGPEAGGRDTRFWFVTCRTEQNQCKADTNLCTWAPGCCGWSELPLRAEESNLCCLSVKTCLSVWNTGSSRASHHLEEWQTMLWYVVVFDLYTNVFTFLWLFVMHLIILTNH